MSISELTNLEDNATPLEESEKINEIIAAIKQVAAMAWPVGSIYTSTKDTNPADLFGGTWEQIKDRFLLACGDIYNAGDLGGEATHTLTADEIPSHTHSAWTDAQGWHAHAINISNSLNDDWPNYNGAVHMGRNGTIQTRNEPVQANGTHGHNVGIGATGGDGAHNNLPPYEVVYCWKRIA